MWKLLCVSLLTLFTQVEGFGQTAWKFITEKDGVKVYTSEVPGSKVKAVKVEALIDATESQLIAVLLDINTSTEWEYHVKSATLVKQVSPSELYYYCEVNLPWPVANRDFVAHISVTQDPNSKVVYMDGPTVPGFVPEKKGMIRIKNSTGKWVITPQESGQLKVEYSLHVDPGGNIPSWLVNMFAAEGPVQQFKKLRMQVQKPQYKNINFTFIDNKSYASN
ncbi:MAG: START domain-containing protein [Mucilaginibacter sp.]|nr:START domain-containing protein [Mucilaginibacter sp.]